jgi:hypothetical protein
VNLPSDGPAGIEFGNVKTSVKMANTAIVLRRTAVRFGVIGGSGLPKKVLWTGILDISAFSRRASSTGYQLLKSASNERPESVAKLDFVLQTLDVVSLSG